ncbi:MAG: hypothetical protein BWY82_02369 [Verrucomicrobia bacterium ADurb.Bin474]|nr:MAG: hypothetical protein BWY82_02369 [Verrucomicrobia bacterium ADurb.Bin474]
MIRNAAEPLLDRDQRLGPAPRGVALENHRIHGGKPSHAAGHIQRLSGQVAPMALKSKCKRAANNLSPCNLESREQHIVDLRVKGVMRRPHQPCSVIDTQSKPDTVQPPFGSLAWRH